jgi:nucleotide-binding universal stress UspA family protein
MTETGAPFTSILVPYDGSEPARAALALALAIRAPDAKLTILTVVDEAPVMAQSTTTVMAFDPTPLFEALDAEGRAHMADAHARCGAHQVVPETLIVHDRPVHGILETAEARACDLIVIGTRARNAIERAFVGSTTMGVMEASDVPVLTTRANEVGGTHPFANVVVAVDDSDAADAAIELAARMKTSFDSHLIAVNVADTTRLNDNSVTYGFNPVPLERDLERGSNDIVTAALRHAHVAPETVEVVLLEGKPATALIDVAADRHAGAIVMGSHGRRGLRRLLLGSVAEAVVRESAVPVLVVRRHDARDA